MGFSCGLVGLPNAGKSTIFNALSNAGARVEPYPFSTVEANVGSVAVPDERLDRLARLFPDKAKIPTHLEVVDIAGLVERASEGEGMGNAFLAQIRAVDAVFHVVRCFDDGDVAHVAGTVSPQRDIGVVETELLLKDLETLSRVAKRLQQETKGTDRSAPARAAAWNSLVEHVSRGGPVRTASVPAVIEALVREASPLTAKPYLFVANLGDQGENALSDSVVVTARERGVPVVFVRGRLEAEVAETASTAEERMQFLAEFGVPDTSLARLVRAGYELLRLVTFFTVEGPEVRAWTVPQGTLAPAAGARIHTDFADRFVLAEVMDLDALVVAGTEKRLRDEGRIRRAGRDYAVRDGDVIHFICS
ncbi:MAG: redox-regulated ATPase YchF [Candidatus Bipolaricaulota bacterium]